MTELERAIQAYCQEHNDDCFEAVGDECPFIEKAFKAGAKWQYEQFEQERLKHCDELTAEQAQIESDFVVQHLKKCNRTPTFIDAIEYGRRLMIDKACEWINLHIGELSDIYTRSAIRNEFLDDFRKAMQNG